ncbi:MAG: PEP-CTERM sorting domain-containing protein [Sedimentisphaerales bacterium]|nr:PEP-CTERM sorting domain-containing protein [Sedimentisphaerales bacterium]
MKRHLLSIAVIILAMQIGSARAVLTLNDGGHHVIDYTVNTLVRVDQDAPGAGTRVDLIEGGFVQAWIDAYEDSQVNILGGRVAASVKAYGRTHLTIAGGEIGGPVFAREASRMEISGGSMESWVQAFDNSEVTISGGEITVFVEAWDDVRMTISGGTISGQIAAIRDSLITLVGSNFAVNGTPVGYGDSAKKYGIMGTITGILANGDMLNNSFSIVGIGADITFIPEPGTLLLIGLGGAGILRRRRL